jgi:hypothetical protein
VASAPVPDQEEAALALHDPRAFNMIPSGDGTLRVKTSEGDFLVTNGVNHIVTTNEQGGTSEVTILAGEDGGRRMVLRTSRRAAGGGGGGSVRFRGEAGPGGAGGSGLGGGGVGGSVEVEEKVVQPPAK